MKKTRACNVALPLLLVLLWRETGDAFVLQPPRALIVRNNVKQDSASSLIRKNNYKYNNGPRQQQEQQQQQQQKEEEKGSIVRLNAHMPPPHLPPEMEKMVVDGAQAITDWSLHLFKTVNSLSSTELPTLPPSIVDAAHNAKEHATATTASVIAVARGAAALNDAVFEAFSITKNATQAAAANMRGSSPPFTIGTTSTSTSIPAQTTKNGFGVSPVFGGKKSNQQRQQQQMASSSNVWNVDTKPKSLPGFESFEGSAEPIQSFQNEGLQPKNIPGFLASFQDNKQDKKTTSTTTTAMSMQDSREPSSSLGASSPTEGATVSTSTFSFAREQATTKRASPREGAKQIRPSGTQLKEDSPEPKTDPGFSPFKDMNAPPKLSSSLSRKEFKPASGTQLKEDSPEPKTEPGFSPFKDMITPPSVSSSSLSRKEFKSGSQLKEDSPEPKTEPGFSPFKDMSTPPSVSSSLSSKKEFRPTFASSGSHLREDSPEPKSEQSFSAFKNMKDPNKSTTGFSPREIVNKNARKASTHTKEDPREPKTIPGSSPFYQEASKVSSSTPLRKATELKSIPGFSPFEGAANNQVEKSAPSPSLSSSSESNMDTAKDSPRSVPGFSSLDSANDSEVTKFEAAPSKQNTNEPQRSIPGFSAFDVAATSETTKKPASTFAESKSVPGFSPFDESPKVKEESASSNDGKVEPKSIPGFSAFDTVAASETTKESSSSSQQTFAKPKGVPGFSPFDEPPKVKRESSSSDNTKVKPKSIPGFSPFDIVAVTSDETIQESSSSVPPKFAEPKSIPGFSPFDGTSNIKESQDVPEVKSVPGFSSFESEVDVKPSFPSSNSFAASNSILGISPFDEINEDQNELDDSSELEQRSTPGFSPFDDADKVEVAVSSSSRWNPGEKSVPGISPFDGYNVAGMTSSSLSSTKQALSEKTSDYSSYERTTGSVSSASYKVAEEPKSIPGFSPFETANEEKVISSSSAQQASAPKNIPGFSPFDESPNSAPKPKIRKSVPGFSPFDSVPDSGGGPLKQKKVSSGVSFSEIVNGASVSSSEDNQKPIVTTMNVNYDGSADWMTNTNSNSNNNNNFSSNSAGGVSGSTPLRSANEFKSWPQEDRSPPPTRGTPASFEETPIQNWRSDNMERRQQQSDVQTLYDNDVQIAPSYTRNSPALEQEIRPPAPMPEVIEETQESLVQEIWEMTSVPALIQGDSISTWSAVQNPPMESVQVMLKTEGRPLRAEVELWQGPDNTPLKMGIYSEDGSLRSFSTVLETTPGSNTIAVRNAGQMEFPVLAAVEANDVGGNNTSPPLCMASRMMYEQGYPRNVQGGTIVTYPFHPTVESIQILLKTDGRPLNARIELLQGPNNVKQAVEVYSQDGRIRPFYGVFESPESGNVVRIINTSTMEYPFFASVEPFQIIQPQSRSPRMEQDNRGRRYSMGA